MSINICKGLSREEIAIKQFFSHIKIKEEITIGQDKRSTININLGQLTKEEEITFHHHPLTEFLLKREPTSSQVQIFSTISKKPLPGKYIASFSDRKPAISLHENQLFFNFDPFLNFFNFSNELGNKIPSKKVNWILKVYRYVPWFIINPIRKIIRGHKVYYEPNDFIGPSNNVLVVLIENFLKYHKYGEENKKKNHPKVILSHDIDTKFCFEKGIPIFYEILKRKNLEATWFIIPHGRRYSLKNNFYEELKDKHEIGIHGYNHDGMFHHLPLKKMKDRVKRSQQIFNSFGIKTTLFRSPFMLRSENLKKALINAGITIDSSYPDRDTLNMTKPLNGVEFNRPFFFMTKDIRGKILMTNLLEIPSSYPQDVQIIEDYGFLKDQIFLYWKNKFDFVKDFGGVFVFHGHPYHLINNIEIYEKLIQYFKKNKAEITTFKKISQEYLKDINTIDLEII